MDPTHLPSDILLNSLNFIPWKARIDITLQTHGLPAVHAEKPETTTDEQWKACSELAARTIHNFLPIELLRQVPSAHHYDHTKLMKALEGLTLRFRFLDLPPELRNMVYRYMMPIAIHIICQKSVSRYPSVLSVSRQLRSEALPIAYSHCFFFLDFRTPQGMSNDELEAHCEDSVDAVTRARQWAKSLSSAHIKHIRTVLLRLLVRSQSDSEDVQARIFGFGYGADKGIESGISKKKGEDLTKESSRMLQAHANMIEEERQMLHLQGESVIMAVTRESDIWKFGTLEC